MESKNRTRCILAGLVVVHVVLHAIGVFVMHALIPGTSDVFTMAFFMLGPSQATLLAVWTVLGGGRFLLRVLLIVLVLALHGWFETPVSEWRLITFGHLCVCGVLLLGARLTGLELTRSSVQERGSRPFQFYIRDILIWTTALAVILSALRCLPAHWLATVEVRDIIIFGSFALVAGVALYSSLGRRWLLVRILGTPLAIIVGAYLPAAIRPFSIWFFALLLGLMAAWLVGSLLLVRLAGYRLTWRWRFGPRDLDAKPPDYDARHEPTSTDAQEST